jgi:hypothetical protein
MLKSDLQSGDLTGKPNYSIQGECEKIGPCVDVTGKDPSTLAVAQEEIDDLTKPVYSAKSESEACSGDVECYQKLTAKTCTTGSAFIDESYTEVYCASVTGYEKKTIDVVALDPVKVQAKADKQAKAALIESYAVAGKAHRAAGSEMIDIITGYLKTKSLTKTQAQALISAFGPVITYFSIGRMDLARDAIEAYQPDGVAFTTESKQLFLDILTDKGF